MDETRHATRASGNVRQLRALHLLCLVCAAIAGVAVLAPVLLTICGCIVVVDLLGLFLVPSRVLSMLSDFNDTAYGTVVNVQQQQQQQQQHGAMAMDVRMDMDGGWVGRAYGVPPAHVADVVTDVAKVVNKTVLVAFNHYKRGAGCFRIVASDADLPTRNWRQDRNNVLDSLVALVVVVGVMAAFITWRNATRGRCAA